ncbi:hypothetical protein SteCoe_20598 [Stentor coeruleus]|uniref:Uncharacterized protein n=1 Tax=Stentor coeruleus TaxID=5963 RepID=A0A1R2BS41_9CILI|nr:hypothetical protein SteCoe_20598 [Stentor coeruleus]
MYWLEKFLPSCCTTRKSSETITNQKIDSTINNQLEILPINKAFSQIVLTKNDNFPLSPSEEHLENSQVSSEVIIEIAKPLEKTPDTPEKSDIKNDTTNKLLCGFCGNLATGYCPGCPLYRFCGECYNENHITQKTPHKFISYMERRNSFSLNNGMKKLKVFM